MSVINVKNEVSAAISSIPLFSDGKSYLETKDEWNRHVSNLLEVSKNVDFIQPSRYFNGKDMKLDLNDCELWTWLFSEGSMTKTQVLSAFVRMQFYRPVFFQYNNYRYFSKDESRYICETQKFFLDHNDVKRAIVWKKDADGQDIWGEIDADGTGLVDAEDYSISDVEYKPIVNRISYTIQYSPIDIVDNRFFFNDVEYYVTYDMDGETKSKPISLFCNEFAGNLDNMDEVAEIDANGEFIIGETRYKVDGEKRILVVDWDVDDEEIWSSSSSSSILDAMYVQEIDVKNNMFAIDGVWYAIDGSKIRYAVNHDNRLVKLWFDQNHMAYNNVDDTRFQWLVEDGKEKI